jgi:hypothetical protein
LRKKEMLQHTYPSEFEIPAIDIHAFTPSSPRGYPADATGPWASLAPESPPAMPSVTAASFTGGGGHAAERVRERLHQKQQAIHGQFDVAKDNQNTTIPSPTFTLLSPRRSPNSKWRAKIQGTEAPRKARWDRILSPESDDDRATSSAAAPGSKNLRSAAELRQKLPRGAHTPSQKSPYLGVLQPIVHPRHIHPVFRYDAAPTDRNSRSDAQIP